MNYAAILFNNVFKRKSVCDLCAATTARTLQAFLVNPILIVKTRFEVVGFNEYKGMMDAFVQIFRREGLRSFFTNGITVALVKDVPFAAIQFPIYQQIRLLLQEAGRRAHMAIDSTQIKCAINASSIFCATFVSCLVTNPLDVIRTRIVFQYYNQNTQQHYISILDAVRKMLKYDGISGLFFGLQARFMKKVLGAVIAWTIFEYLKDSQMHHLLK